MKKSINLLLTAEEKATLRAQKTKIADLTTFASDEVAMILNADTERAREINALIEFQSIPSLGINFATELIQQGYYSLQQLEGKDPVELFNAFERHVGAWADPCVEDSYRLLADYIKYGNTGKSWWHFTAERKAYRAEHGFPANRPAKAWYELPQYRKGKEFVGSK